MRIFKFKKEKVLRWIELKEWDQRRFAKELGIHEADLSQIFSGKRKPSLKVLSKVRNITGLSLDDIVSREK